MTCIPSGGRGFLCRGMPRLLTAALGALLLAAGLASTSGEAQRVYHPTFPWVEPARLDPEVVERLLAAYDTGRYADFDRLVEPFRASVVNPFEFEADAERWIEAAADRRRRAFVAAAVALELARPPRPRVPPTLDMLSRLDRASLMDVRTIVEVGFVLAELGCTWLRDHPPSAAEGAWQAAFVTLARATGQHGYVIGIPLQIPRLARLAGWHEREIQRLAVGAERERHEDEEGWQRAHAGLLARLRSQATRISGSPRVEVSRRRFEHGPHLLARLPEDPFLPFLAATVRDDQTRHAVALLDRGFAPVWTDASEVERIARGGERQVRALPPNRRMDRPSAERLLRLVPEPREVAFSSHIGVLGIRQPASAAFASVTLWEAVDAWRAVPDREPVAAETALRLGHAYARLARPDMALPAFGRAESLATTPYEAYLARFFAGVVFADIGRRTEAIQALQGALHAVPRAQSAAFALAPLLLELDADEQAAALLEAAVTLPLADDPLDYYYEGDPAALARAMAHLRDEATR